MNTCMSGCPYFTFYAFEIADNFPVSEIMTVKVLCNSSF